MPQVRQRLFGKGEAIANPLILNGLLKCSATVSRRLITDTNGVQTEIVTGTAGFVRAVLVPLHREGDALTTFRADHEVLPLHATSMARSGQAFWRGIIPAAWRACNCSAPSERGLRIQEGGGPGSARSPNSRPGTHGKFQA